MNAIELLEEQHREVEKLFDEFESAGERAEKTKERIFRRLADAIAIHSEIEEKLFYPESKTSETEDLLREALEEHLSVKRVIADLLESEPGDERFDAQMKVLREQIEHHVEHEEGELFPSVNQEMSREELDDLGLRMQQLAEELESEGEPAQHIPGQIEEPPRI